MTLKRRNLSPLNWNVDRLKMQRGPINSPILSIFKLIYLKLPDWVLPTRSPLICFCQYWLFLKDELLYVRSISYAPHWLKILRLLLLKIGFWHQRNRHITTFSLVFSLAIKLEGWNGSLLKSRACGHRLFQYFSVIISWHSQCNDRIKDRLRNIDTQPKKIRSWKRRKHANWS